MVHRLSPTYHANLLPLWDHWVVEVPDAGGVHAIVFTIGDAERTAREAIATVLGVTPESFTVIVQPSTSSPIEVADATVRGRSVDAVWIE